MHVAWEVGSVPGYVLSNLTDIRLFEFFFDTFHDFLWKFFNIAS